MSLVKDKLPVSGVTTISLCDLNLNVLVTSETDAEGNFQIVISDADPNTFGYNFQGTSFRVTYSGAFAPAGSEYWTIPVRSNLKGRAGTYSHAQVTCGTTPLW
jgi:hypothetical protein